MNGIYLLFCQAINTNAMKNLFCFILVQLTITFCLNAFAQQVDIPSGSAAVIDGILSPGEWDDADYRLIEVKDSWEVKVYYKHTDTCLYFAYTNLISGIEQRYPDVMLDITNGKDTSWQPDDWWFHASYNDCQAKGSYNVWTSCKPSNPGWKANNFPLNDPGTVEMEITYALAGIPSGSTDTLGISFEVSDTYNDYHYFPFNADIAKPSTWIDAILLKSTSSVEEEKALRISVSPNPSSSRTLISFFNPEKKDYSLTVYDQFGRIILVKQNIKDNQSEINCENWRKGLYFIELGNITGMKGLVKFVKE